MNTILKMKPVDIQNTPADKLIEEVYSFLDKLQENEENKFDIGMARI